MRTSPNLDLVNLLYNIIICPDMQEQAQQYHLLCLFTVLRAPPLYTCENGFYCASVTNAARLSTVQKGAKKDATLQLRLF